MIKVVYAMTHHVYSWILPSLRSLKDHNPDAKVYILAEHDRLPFDLPMPAEVINVTGQTWFPVSGKNYNNDFKYINLLKVRYPSILPADKVIHLDIDTIVADDLQEMYDTDLTGKWFGAVPEYKGCYRPFGDLYYNMGVAVINLEQMRRDGIEQEMQDYLNDVKQPYADQDAWNKCAIRDGKAVTLPIRWNEGIPTGTTNSPAIVHYCAIKDWYTRFNMHRVGYLNQYRKE